jgi:hypothetical protein
MEPSASKCGDMFDGQQGRDGPLVMTGSFPEHVRSGSGLHGTVTLTNPADIRIRGTSASQPDIFVTEAGEIVATPVARDDVGVLLDLAPGASRVFDATGSLLRCSPEVGPGSSGEQPLAPGRYEIHAVLPVLGGEEGRSVTVLGGPWALEVE